MDLKRLTEIVVRSWSFNEDTYPDLAGATPSERTLFAMRHILLHVQKDVGKLASVCEAADHRNKEINVYEVPLIVRNFLMNTLRLAEVAKVTPEELGQLVLKWEKEKR